MRKIVNLQPSLFNPSIPEIQFDLNSRDEIPKLLMGLQAIYSNTELREEVITILRKVIPENINPDTGRPGMDLWQILVLGVLRLNCDWDYDKVREIANEHRKVRQMMGHDENDFRKSYGLQTIKDNVSLLTEEILDEINQVVVKFGHSLLGKKAEELNGNCDSTVIKTDVHFPTDISLLFDAIRKVITLLAVVCEALGVEGWRQHEHNLKKIRKLFTKARNLKSSTSKDDNKKAEREKIIRSAYEMYIEVVESFLKRAEETLLIIEQSSLVIKFAVYVLAIENYINHARRQIDQIRRRVLEGGKIPHDEKVFSIFEEHTEWICKGKAGVKQEPGLRVCILKDQFGFILHHQVMEKVTDDKIAVSMVVETRKRFPNLTGCSFDRGFYTPDNKKNLKEILDRLVMPKKGKLSEKDKEEEYSEEFIAGRHKHSSVESSLSALKNHSLERCPDHGIDGFKRYVALGVLARNIQILGHIIQQKKLKQEQRQKQRLAA